MTETTKDSTAGSTPAPRVHQLMRQLAETAQAAREATEEREPYFYAGDACEAVQGLATTLRQFPDIAGNTVHELRLMEQRGGLYVSRLGPDSVPPETVVTEMEEMAAGLAAGLRVAAFHADRMCRLASRLGTET